GIAVPHPPAEETRHVGRRENPQEAGDDDRQADSEAPGRELQRWHAAQSCYHLAQLQADQDEGEAVQDEDDQVPDRDRLDPGGGGDDLGATPPGVDPAYGDRQHAGDPHGLGQQVGGVGHEQGQDDRQQRVVEPTPYLGQRPADRQPEGHAADDRDQERGSRLPPDEH